MNEIPVLHDVKEFVHFCCTSEDINNVAYSLMLSEARNKILLKSLDELINKFVTISEQNANRSMLSKTHGQVASPTTVG